jgi:hypothetical protein
MPLISGTHYLLPCCSYKITTPVEQTTPTILKHKIEHSWNIFCMAIKSSLHPNVQKNIQHEINKLDKIEITQTKPVYCSALRRAFASSMNLIKSAEMDPSQLPKQIAWQLTEILFRFGVAIYANKDVTHPFQSSFDVLKAALLMQQYALGITKTSPDFSQLMILDDIYTNPDALAITPLADYAIDYMEPSEWATRTFMLTQNQQLMIPQLLRYLNGAMNYLKLSTLPSSEKLLKTAEACLLSAQKKPVFNQTEVNNQLAELKYNEMTGFLARQLQDYEEREMVFEAIETKQTLRNIWDECVALSKDPEQMQARCDNKRIFVEKLNAKEQLELSLSALNRHLALPKERQNPTLVTIAHHNLSHSYKGMNDLENAIKHADIALKRVIEAQSKGENNAQFDSISTHAQALKS